MNSVAWGFVEAPLGCQARFIWWSLSLCVRKMINDFRCQLLLHRRVQHIRQLDERLPVIIEPVVVVDDRREVAMDLVTGVVEVVDCGKAIANGRGALSRRSS